MVIQIARGRQTFRRLNMSILEFLNNSDRIASMAANAIVGGLRKRIGEVRALGGSRRNQTRKSGRPTDAAEAKR